MAGICTIRCFSGTYNSGMSQALRSLSDSLVYKKEREEIKRQKRREEFWQKVKMSFDGALAIAAVIGYAIVFYLMFPLLRLAYYAICALANFTLLAYSFAVGGITLAVVIFYAICEPS